MRRPDVFTLDYSHRLAHGLVFAGLGNSPGDRFLDDSFRRSHGALFNMGAGQWSNMSGTGRNFISFDGVNDYIRCSGSPIFQSLSGVWSIAIWYYNAGIDAVNHFILSESKIESASSLNGVSIRRNGTGLYVISDVSTTGAATYRANGFFESAEVAHLCVVCNNSHIMRIFKNGIEVGGFTYLSTEYAIPTQTTDPLCIGRCGIGTFTYEGYWQGKLADPLIYNRALSPTEISLLADRTDPMLSGLIVEDRPVLWFDMGGTGTDALTSNGLVIGPPILETPSLGQVHSLSATAVVAESPVIGATTLAQIHALVAPSLSPSAPVLDPPLLSENQPNVDNLSATNIVVGVPEFGVTSIGQVHSLTETQVSAGAPYFVPPTLSEVGPGVNALLADSIVVGIPEIVSPTLQQIHTLIVADFFAGVSVLGVPALHNGVITEEDAVFFKISGISSLSFKSYVSLITYFDSVSMMKKTFISQSGVDVQKN